MRQKTIEVYEKSHSQTVIRLVIGTENQQTFENSNINEN